MLIIITAGTSGAEDKSLVEPEQLKAKLGQSDLVILDVRIASDWKRSDYKIRGALRVDPHDVSSWANKFAKDSAVVVYCS
jgi:rhodanese-related sulfurtransferase